MLHSITVKWVNISVLGGIAATYKANWLASATKGKENHSTSPEDFHMDKDKDTGLSRLDTAKHEACFSTVLAKEQEARRVRL